MNMVHTTIETKGNDTRMVYHNTCVAEFAPVSDKCKAQENQYIVSLNTGGFFTKTTKKRMNQFAEMFDLPFRVYQNCGHWFVSDTGTGVKVIAQFVGNTCTFTVIRGV